MTIAIIGDVHGKINAFFKLMQKHKPKHTVQIGDFGFKEDHEWFIKNMPKKFEGTHKVLLGNHDDTHYKHYPHSLGDYGVYEGIFFVRGARSIDRHLRIEGRDWWRDEELETSEQLRCLDLYFETKPRIVISHDAPQVACRDMFGIENESSTSKFLQALFEIHKPEAWYFGHHHISKTQEIEGTRFQCLAELELVTINTNIP